MHFSDALMYLKEQQPIRRRSWPVTASLSIIDGVPCKFMARRSFDAPVPAYGSADRSFRVVELLYPKHIALWHAGGVEPWTISHADVLADDWEVAQ